MSLFLAGKGGGGGDGKDSMVSGAGNCCSRICMMVSCYEWVAGIADRNDVIMNTKPKAEIK